MSYQVGLLKTKISLQVPVQCSTLIVGCPISIDSLSTSILIKDFTQIVLPVRLFRHDILLKVLPPTNDVSQLAFLHVNVLLFSVG